MEKNVDLVNQTELINRILDTENRKIEVEKLRESNIAKELDISAESGKEATKIAELDIKYQTEQNKEKNKIFSMISIFTFIVVMTLIIVVAIALFIFGKNDPDILDKIMSYIFDFFKVVIGAIIGFLFEKTRK